MTYARVVPRTCICMAHKFYSPNLEGVTMVWGMLVVHHGIKDACGGTCYVGDAWGQMVFGDDAWGAPKFEESLHGRVMGMIG